MVSTLQWNPKELTSQYNIIKQIPLPIEKRISNLSSNKEIFNEAAEYYEKAFNKCSYKHKLTYVEPTQCDEIRRGRARKRNLIWFNPPFIKNVATNVGKYFLNFDQQTFSKKSQVQ